MPTVSKSRYFDGKIAKPHDVDVFIFDGKLIGETSSREVLFAWQIDEIFVVEDASKYKEAVISSQAYNEARLSIEDPLFQELKPLINRMARSPYKVSTSFVSIVFLFVAAIISGFVIYQTVPKLSPIIAQHIPHSWEEHLADNVYKAVFKNDKVCRSEKGHHALKKLLSEMGLHKNEALKTVTVVDNKTINAFALPAGRVVLYRGFLDRAGSPEEVAGVIAHEVAHLIKKHPTQGLIRRLGLTFVTRLMLGDIGDVTVLGQTLYELHHSRNDEREADKIGVEILQANNIDPNGFRSFFVRVEKISFSPDSNVLKYLSSHPKTSERIDAIPQSDENKAYKTLLSEEEWLALKAICDD